MIFKKSFEINAADGNKISGDFFFKESIEKRPLLIISHGFKAHKDWGFFPYIAEKFCEANFLVITFNFSMNGFDNSSNSFKYVEKFAHNTVSQEIQDLENIIDFLNRKSELSLFLEKFWNKELHLLGHSRGAAISLIVAKRNIYIKKLAMWNPIATFDRWTARQKEIWQQKGFLEFKDNSLNLNLKIDIKYLKDIQNNEYNLINAVKSINIPLLLLHCEQDMTVKKGEFENLKYNIYSNSSEIINIPNTGHTFGISEKMQKSTEHLDFAINKTIEFLKNNE